MELLWNELLRFKKFIFLCYRIWNTIKLYIFLESQLRSWSWKKAHLAAQYIRHLKLDVSVWNGGIQRKRTHSRSDEMRQFGRNASEMQRRETSAKQEPVNSAWLPWHRAEGPVLQSPVKQRNIKTGNSVQHSIDFIQRFHFSLHILLAEWIKLTFMDEQKFAYSAEDCSVICCG